MSKYEAKKVIQSWVEEAQSFSRIEDTKEEKAAKWRITRAAMDVVYASMAAEAAAAA